MSYMETTPIPVFPTEGAIDLAHTRTPMAIAVAAAGEQAIDHAQIITNGPALPEGLIKELAAHFIEDYLEDYARGLEGAAMAASVEEKPTGVLAVWHGSQVTIYLDQTITPGYLVERRCFCRTEAEQQARHRQADYN
jgi:hypothetical protein